MPWTAALQLELDRYTMAHALGKDAKEDKDEGIFDVQCAYCALQMPDCLSSQLRLLRTVKDAAAHVTAVASAVVKWSFQEGLQEVCTGAQRQAPQGW